VNLLISGATGFIGSHLVVTLAKDGYHCKCLVRKTSDISKLKDSRNVEFVYGDITDKTSLESAVKDVDVVYHLAAQIGKWGIPDETFFSVNVEGTRNLLEAAYKSQVRHFVFCSTPGVQGKGHRQAPETLPFRPPYIYELTKSEAEKIVTGFHGKRKNLSVTILRPDFVYGPGDMRRLTLYRTIKHKRFYLIGRGGSVLHPTYIDDAIQGFLKVAKNPVSFGEIYNIAGLYSMTVKEYVETIAGALGVSLPRLRVPRALAGGAAWVSEFLSNLRGKELFLSKSKIEFLTTDHGSDISKAVAQLGYSPKVEFEEGMRRTIDWYCRQDLL